MSSEPGGRALVGRRAILMAAGGLAMSAPLRAFAERASRLLPQEGPRGRRPLADYGPLVAAPDATTGLLLLLLPEGFRYASFGWTGDPLADGTATPGMHDGMAAFAGPSGLVRLIRNHEVTNDRGSFAGRPVYDPVAGGGTTSLDFDPDAGRLVRAWPSLAGTVRNCAGGPTPWGTWLTCEETTIEPGPAGRYARPHGFVFEVPADGEATAAPIEAMGRFVHEAVAVDPATGYVYLTEDTSRAGFYRFVPDRPRLLGAGGSLEMLAVRGRPRIDFRRRQKVGQEHAVEWVEIADPGRAHLRPGSGDGRGVFGQGVSLGGASFSRLEGAWYGNERIYFASTDGGSAKSGQVWEYDPADERLRLLFESPSRQVLARPDNLCVSPRGGLVLCEDGEGVQSLHGLTADGRIFLFARNNVRLSGERNGITGDFREREFAGACYSPDGQWLFVNVQRPGITLAITGPWGRGAL